MLPLDPWPRAESVRFLGERRGEADDDRAADRVADALGDLPLALEQAAAYCEQTGTTLSNYADLLAQGYGAELWREPRDLERTVAAVWEVSFSKVEADSPRPVRCCCTFAPFSRPTTSLSMRYAPALALPEPLKGAVDRPVAFNTAVGALLRYSLARRDGETLSIYCTRQRAISVSSGLGLAGAQASPPSGATHFLQCYSDKTSQNDLNRPVHDARVWAPSRSPSCASTRFQTVGSHFP